MGHAIYSVSDPRAEVLKSFVESLAKEKGRMKDYNLYSMVEKMAPEVIAEERRIYKGVSANVDFTVDLCTVCWIFLWSFIHRCLRWHVLGLERSSYGGELINADKIIRPAHKNVLEAAEYVPLDQR